MVTAFFAAGTFLWFLGFGLGLVQIVSAALSGIDVMEEETFSNYQMRTVGRIYLAGFCLNGIGVLLKFFS